MVWEISKDFEFSYGHRVHTQDLDPELSLNAPCKCRHLHGHEGKVSVYLEGDELNKTGMILDFNELSWLKKFLDDNIDHKFIIDSNDPIFSYMLDEEAGFDTVDVEVPGTEWVVGKRIDLSDFEEGTAEYEYFESFFIVDFVPTSENLAQWAWKVAQCKLIEHEIYVSKIVWSETAKSKATYIHVEQPPEPTPPDPEDVAKMEAILEKRRNTWIPPEGGFDLYGANRNESKDTPSAEDTAD